MLINTLKIRKSDAHIYSHMCITILYLLMLICLPRLGSHLKYSELVFPIVFLSTLSLFPRVVKLFGSKVLFYIGLFFLLVFLSNLISFFVLNAGIQYLILLPVRYIEIITLLFAVALVAYYRPTQLLISFKYIFLIVVAYVIANIIFGFQRGFYGIVVLPGESVAIQVGTVFSFFAIYFFWIYLSKNNKQINGILTKKISNNSFVYFLISFVLVLLNVQRTSIVALGMVVFLALLIIFILNYYSILIQYVNMAVFSAASLLFGLFIISYFGGDFLETLLRIIYRFEALESASNLRFNRWMSAFNLEVWSVFTLTFGVGLGAHNYFADLGGFTLAFDNLPLRLLFETGIVGLITFAVFHVSLVRLVYSRSKIIGLFAVLVFLFMLGMSITFEAPFVYVPGSVFYAFLGTAVGMSYHLKERDLKNRAIRNQLP